MDGIKGSVLVALVRAVLLLERLGVGAQTTTTSPPSCTLTPPATLPSSASSCSSAYNEWMWGDDNAITSTLPYSITIEYSASTNTSLVPYTTLCDGMPRALDRITTYRAWITHTITDATMTTRIPTRFAPDCSIEAGSPECLALWTQYAYERECIGTKPARESPPCGQTPTTCPTTYTGGSSQCRIAAHDPTVLYWPVTTTGDFCGTLTTVPATPTAPDGAPNTAVYNGATYTSPSVYFLFSAQAWKTTSRRNWATCGPSPTARVTLSFAPTAVSSALKPTPPGVHAPSLITPERFNFADLNTVPAGEYSSFCNNRADGYHWEGCETIWKNYAPYVTVPSEVTALRSEWSACTAWQAFQPVYVALGVEGEGATRFGHGVEIETSEDGGMSTISPAPRVGGMVEGVEGLVTVTATATGDGF